MCGVFVVGVPYRHACICTCVPFASQGGEFEKKRVCSEIKVSKATRSCGSGGDDSVG